jgi:hypothetical protein
MTGNATRRSRLPREGAESEPLAKALDADAADALSAPPNSTPATRSQTRMAATREKEACVRGASTSRAAGGSTVAASDASSGDSPLSREDAPASSTPSAQRFALSMSKGALARFEDMPAFLR